jgi:hypothetical protein
VQVAGDHLGALGLGVPSGDVGRLPVQLSLERLARSSGTKYSGPRKIPIITTTKFPGIQSRAHRHNRHNKPAHPTGSISLISQFTVFAGLSMPLSCQYLVTNCRCYCRAISQKSWRIVIKVLTTFVEAYAPAGFGPRSGQAPK